VARRERRHEIEGRPEIADRARRAVERMIEIGPTAGSARLPVGTPNE